MTPEELARAAPLLQRMVVARTAGAPPRLGVLREIAPDGRWASFSVDATPTDAGALLALHAYAPPRRTLVPVEAQVRVPWKNGLGTTRELAVEPPGAGTGAFLWRVSLAWVDRSCPFSTFPGHDRTIILVSGEGFTLDFGDAAPPRTLRTLLERCEFKGEWTTSCALLGGAVEDLNVMVDRERAQARVTVASSASTLPLVHPTLVAVALGGPVRLRLLEAEPVRLEPGDAVRLDRALPTLCDEAVWLEPEREASVVLIELGPR